MNKIIDKIKSIFKVKIIDVEIEYFKDSYVFNSLTEEAKKKISESLSLMNEVDSLESVSLSPDNAIVFSDELPLEQRIFEEIINDYNMNKKESDKGDFLFKYLLTEIDIEPNALRVTVELSDPNQSRGNVYYSMTIKKKNGKYYLWLFED